jgi:DNA-binding LytR/AlgR family response regulator
MKIVIVEDEKIAAEQLKLFIQSYAPSLEVVQIIDSCKGFRKWLQKKEEVDLIFCDIELTDGNVLATLKKTELNAAIIFTTAYDNFWREALKFNGIDYILKPMTLEKVHEALNKIETIKRIFNKDKTILSKLTSMLNRHSAGFYKKRFPVRINNDVFVLESDSIIFFRIIEGIIMAYTAKGKKYPMEKETLNNLETQLNPELFFRINRSEIINAQYIESIKIYDSNEYMVLLKESEEKLSVSNSRISNLKEWLDDPMLNLRDK